MFYFVRTYWWLKLFYPGCVWEVKTSEKAIYLTFDDGPHPVATPFVLEQLQQYNAKATFFCIGKNADEHYKIYERIIEEAHAVGNHTYNHLNAWKTKEGVYMNDVYAAKKIINSNLFRPPYGRINNFLVSQLSKEKYNLKTIMWSVLSGDFDKNLSNENCYLNVIRNSKPGSIIVFHDSYKAFEKLQFTLPKVLKYFSDKGYIFKSIF